MNQDMFGEMRESSTELPLELALKCVAELEGISYELAEARLAKLTNQPLMYLSGELS
jgi:hypothetical protein